MNKAENASTSGFAPLKFILDTGDTLTLRTGDKHALSDEDRAEGYTDLLNFSISSTSGKLLDDGNILFPEDVKSVYGNLKEALPGVLKELGLNCNFASLCPTKLSLGATYTMAGYEWIAIRVKKEVVVLQSTGVTSGAWPGYALFGKGEAYAKGISYSNISDYDDKTKELYHRIRHVESKNPACPGIGLYLFRKEDIEDNNAYAFNAYAKAAGNASLYDADGLGVWTGSPSDARSAYAWYNEGGASPAYPRISYVVAPAFNLDPSRVILDGNAIDPYPWT